MKKITLTLFIVLLAGAAIAQPAPRSRHDRPDFDRPPREMLEGFRLFKLTEELELSEEQTAKIYPLIAEMNKERDENHEAVEAKLKALKEMLAQDKVDARASAEAAMEIHAMRGEWMQRHHAMQAELLDLLDDGQKAKYVLFDKQFDRHLRGVKERIHDRFDEDRPARPGPSRRR